MPNEPAIEIKCACPSCGTINTVVQRGLPPGAVVACSKCAQKLGTIEELMRPPALEPGEDDGNSA